MKNKEKYLTNFSEAKRKKATQKYNIIKPFILGEQSLSSISKSKGIALSTLYRWNKSYKEQGLKGLIYATRADKWCVLEIKSFYIHEYFIKFFFQKIICI